MKASSKKLLHKLYTILVYINYHLSRKKFHKFIFIHPPQSGGNTIDYFFKMGNSNSVELNHENMNKPVVKKQYKNQKKYVCII